MSTFFQKQQQVAALDPRIGGLMMSAGLYNLRSLIKGVRACKTLADERSLLQKESAAIRTAFKDDDVYARYNNLSKLLYIHMLGYPAHFGQMECLKLVASPRFSDKRLGYLGIMLLLDENAQVLMLITNGLKNDMNHSNMFVIGLALCTFANIASEEMSRDLANEIERLMGSANSYVRKKAALCAMRIVRKVPDLIDHFFERSLQLLGDKNHGVLLCALSLAMEISHIEPSLIDAYRRVTPVLVQTLRTLLSTSFSPEHDVGGTTDPFLQVKILRFLRVLGRDSEAVSDAINDTLAQVATNTEANKNVGNAILYECVLTILEIRADSGLRVMGINILGRFLGNRDNNIRYVALNTLNKVVALDTNAVQRHRATILECLRDADISIRRRALDLTYALINQANVLVLMPELLSFLEVADTEFKLGLTTQISAAAERYAPDKRWHLDTMLHVLRIAGNYIRDEVLGSFIRLVSHTPELQAYTAQCLYSALRSDMSQESQTLATVWVIGEFGEVLFDAGQVDAASVLDLLSSSLESPYTNDTICQYVLTALAKLYVRINDPTQQQRCSDILARYRGSIDAETQKHAVEYSALLRRGIRDAVLETMPLPEIRQTILGTVSETKPVGPTRELAQNTQNTQDLLADIFGGSDAPAPAPQAHKSAAADIMSLFDSDAPRAAAAPAPTPAVAGATAALADLGLDEPAPALSVPEHVAYEQNGLRITIAAVPSSDGAELTALFTSTRVVEGIAFQAAVPKTQRLQMQAITSATVAPGRTETQTMRVSGTGGAPVRLRIRIAYTVDGAPMRDQVDWKQP